ncbi:Asp23/Gls24 family envelope stress response protein [Thermobrachium celere]|uniref:FIG001802: Putative alkaline-shock protein n=1 Tax=Thermobrachium celere DSM 8682 TaxID=941824 RepID=R7RRH7_9CLOT|nr:Asp23/Gls24 family envelope stress response protein [Thermobrachium celere]GFR35074.1 alkaline-shock protein [Thermobrachium celere]CDF57898.1 FIG001802: Putative alkaline-shock protein [Thermobrachium celere DSM 8682]
MAIKINNDYGFIEYTDEVLANIAGAATMECYGVVGMASKRASDGFWELLKRENLSKGVKIISEEDGIVVNLYIIVEYGTKISVIADNIIQKVKYTIESLTGINVKKVTVSIQGIRV